MIILVNGAYEPQLSELFLEVMNDSGSKLEKASGQPKDIISFMSIFYLKYEETF